MGHQVRQWGVAFTLLLIHWASGEEGSLQGALNAINRRQMGLAAYPKFQKFYSESGVSRYRPPENDLVFFGPADTRTLLDGKQKSPLEYLEDIDLSNRQMSSAFRERTAAGNKMHERQTLNEMLSGEEGKNNEDGYSQLLREFYNKYGRSEPQNGLSANYHDENELRKRNNNRRYTSTVGLNMVGMRKRNDHGYPPFVEDADSTEGVYVAVPGVPRNQVYVNSMAKRFPVTKRSSNYYPIPFTDEMSRQFKRSSTAPQSLNNRDGLPQTDPKVAQDLSSIFEKSPDRKESRQRNRNVETMDKTVSKPKKTEHATETTTGKTTADSKATTVSTQVSAIKETFSNDKVANAAADEKEKPIQIKKKSIDWSDYFGIDKRKKSDGLDNEWLMERYHKAVALTSKRNSDMMNAGDERATNKTKSYSSSASRVTDEKINDMDTKLRNIEYAIVDDALKATRSHSDGEFDPQEVQEMKDRVISQLAAAYSLEKMRHALKEYRESIRKERLATKAAALVLKSEEPAKLEEKRLSVPRKSAGDMEDTAGADNNIRCATSGDDNCYEQNYRTPEDLLDGANFGYCPKIQRACSEIASILGRYEKILEVACTMHQMCLFCGDSTWFSPVRQCNALFLSKADYLCNDDPACRDVARHSTRYLLELNKLLRSEPQLLDTCELAC